MPATWNCFEGGHVDAGAGRVSGGGMRRVVRAMQRLVPRSPSGIRILCYHLIDGGTGSPVDVPLADFEEQMAALAQESRPVSLRRALTLLGEPLDEERSMEPSAGDGGYIVVTFDDAYRNFREAAWPVLQRLRIPVTLFVPVGFVDGDCPGPLGRAESLPPLTWAEIGEMLDGDLLTVGAHTRTHPPDLRELEDDRLAPELFGARRELEDRLGVTVESFCYPRGLWDARVESMVREAYDLALVGGGRRLTSGRVDRHRLSRTSVRQNPPFPIREWLRYPLWLEEALADVWRRF